MKRIILAVFAAALCSGLASPSLAAAPTTLTYQGRLKDTGQPVTGARTIDIILQSCDTGVCGSSYDTGAQGVWVSNGLFRTTFTVPASFDLSAGQWYLEVLVNGTPLTPRELLSSTPYALYASSAETLSPANGAAYATVTSPVYFAAQGDSEFSILTASGITVAPGAGVFADYFNGLYYGDGSQLTGVVASGSLPKTGGTMTGPLTLFGSSATIVDANSSHSFSLSATSAPDRSVYHVVVTTYGGVGIGTTVPANKLSVAGSGEFSASVLTPQVSGLSAAGSTLTVTGTAGSGSTPGGNVVIKGGSAPGDGGDITLTAADSTLSGAGGDILLAAGSAGSGNPGAGGIIQLKPGARGDAASAVGYVEITAVSAGAAHLRVTQASTPSSTFIGSCGTGGSVTLDSNSTDMAGGITIVTGTGTPAVGCGIQVGFAKAYGAAPKAILLTPTTAVSHSIGAIVENVAATSFQANTASAPPASTTLHWYYLVIE